jgi:hypothetical protein
LKSRENPKDFNTDNEKNLFVHTNDHKFYTGLGNQALKSRVVFDLFFGLAA